MRSEERWLAAEEGQRYIHRSDYTWFWHYLRMTTNGISLDRREGHFASDTNRLMLLGVMTTIRCSTGLNSQQWCSRS